jgi:hypothetical protein
MIRKKFMKQKIKKHFKNLYSMSWETTFNRLKSLGFKSKEASFSLEEESGFK